VALGSDSEPMVYNYGLPRECSYSVFREGNFHATHFSETSKNFHRTTPPDTVVKKLEFLEL